jgi:hypothetical protein
MFDCRPVLPCCTTACSRLRQQLQSEQQQNAMLLVAVRSVQRSQAAAAGAYLAGVMNPDSPPASRPTSAAAAGGSLAGAWLYSRPGSAVTAARGSRKPQPASLNPWAPPQVLNPWVAGVAAVSKGVGPSGRGVVAAAGGSLGRGVVRPASAPGVSQ